MFNAIFRTLVGGSYSSAEKQSVYLIVAQTELTNMCKKQINTLITYTVWKPIRENIFSYFAK